MSKKTNCTTVDLNGARKHRCPNGTADKCDFYEEYKYSEDGYEMSECISVNPLTLECENEAAWPENQEADDEAV